ncbi:MAG: S24/S26 family peptidase [Lachnospiraceae bacterium]|nr:S24/S26 family peptidase [Lachnospiraceae bacterium]
MEQQILARKRMVKAEEYIPVIRGLVEEGNIVPFLITGNSMSPFMIHERDTILLKKPEHPLKKGTMAFYQRKSGQYVMHRICKVKQGKYYFVGDAQTEVEGPLEPEQIFAVVCGVKRKGKLEEPGTFWWEFFEHIWLPLRPLRPVLRKLYTIGKTLVTRK